MADVTGLMMCKEADKPKRIEDQAYVQSTGVIGLVQTDVDLGKRHCDGLAPRISMADHDVAAVSK